MDKSILSVMCDDSSHKIVQRADHMLLRPVYINAVEIGYFHCRFGQIPKKLNVKAIMSTLWYFISRGHYAQALLPCSFKNHPIRCDNVKDLIRLQRLQLVEFIPSIGYDKYVEINRIIISRARDNGGCVVAYSNMLNIIEKEPIFESTVRERLLIPCFNGCEAIFPLDGTVDFNGIRLSPSLICKEFSHEWQRCSSVQLLAKDQSLNMHLLAAMSPEILGWLSLVHKLDEYHAVQPISGPNNFITNLPPSYGYLMSPYIQNRSWREKQRYNRNFFQSKNRRFNDFCPMYPRNRDEEYFYPIYRSLPEKASFNEEYDNMVADPAPSVAYQGARNRVNCELPPEHLPVPPATFPTIHEDVEISQEWFSAVEHKIQKPELCVLTNAEDKLEDEEIASVVEQLSNSDGPPQSYVSVNLPSERVLDSPGRMDSLSDEYLVNDLNCYFPDDFDLISF